MGNFKAPGEEQCEVCGKIMPKRFLRHHMNDAGQWCDETWDDHWLNKKLFTKKGKS